MALVQEIFEEIKNPVRSVRMKTKAITATTTSATATTSSTMKKSKKSSKTKSVKKTRVVCNPKNLLKIKIKIISKIGKKSKPSAVTLKFFGKSEKVEKIVDLPIYIKVSGTKTLGELPPKFVFI